MHKDVCIAKLLMFDLTIGEESRFMFSKKDQGSSIILLQGAYSTYSSTCFPLIRDLVGVFKVTMIFEVVENRISVLIDDASKWLCQ